ncbi:hypothetical protein U2I54_22535 [Bacillus pseudomycoides]|uniref:Uncharacterized protein n=1 Tax=Bacillus bingmayongensis TaxID=1150157 RepID=A0ABU5K266_9BACI|nr:hypothetical protein [Bacillus pseudomycoides]
MKMAFADFRKAFKKPESVTSITNEQMEVLMGGKEPEVKCYATTPIQANTGHTISRGLYVVPIKQDGTNGKPTVLIAQPTNESENGLRCPYSFPEYG